MEAVAYQMKTDSIQEKDFAKLIKAGNSTAFALAFHQYKEILFRHAFRILRDMDETEDVIQEVFSNLWEKREQIPDNVQLAAYLYRTVRNTVLNKLSHQKVIDKYLKYNLLKPAIHEESADQSLLEKELASIIEQEIQKLPERMRQVFLLSRQEGLSHKEIAELLHITEGTSKLQVSNALKILRGKVLQAILILAAIS